MVYAWKALDIYKSTTVLKVSKPQGNILETQFTQALPEMQADRFLLNEIEIIKSYRVRQKVAQALVDTFKLKNTPSKFYLIIDKKTRNKKNVDPQLADISDIVGELGKVDVEQKRGLDFIEISVQSPKPEEAALIANVYGQTYKEVNLEIARNQLTIVREFLTQQREEKLKQLNMSEDMLKGFQERGGIVALDQQASALIDQLSDLESRRDMQKIDLISSEKVLQKYRDELKLRSPQISSYIEKSANEEYMLSLQRQLAELKINKEYVTLSLKDQTAVGEAVKDYDKKIAAIQHLLDQRVEVLKSSVSAATPEELRSLTQLIIQEELKVSTLKSSIEQMTKLISTYDQKFNLLPKSSIELARLHRNRESIEKLFLLVEQKYQEAVINEQSQTGNVLVLDQARIPALPSKPNRTLIVSVGAVLGMAIAFGYVFLRNFFDNTVKTPDDVQKLNTNVLAWIPQIEGIVATGSSDFEFIVAKKPDSIPSESFRALRTRVQFSRVDSSTLKTILITSSAPSEGKTMICTNLAGSFAFSNKKTIIVDCDLRKPRIHSFFKTNRYPGLVDYLFGQVTFEEIIRQSEIPDLWYITAGTIPPNPSEILESQKMRDFLDMIREKYDYVLLDSPPIIAVTDSEILARYADATALVVSANTTEVELMMRSIEIIQQDDINFIGVILNNFVYKSSYGSYYKYYYYYTRPRKADKSKLPPQQLST
jgi:tyrosine-protein kinase Etk/Wzc